MILKNITPSVLSINEWQYVRTVQLYDSNSSESNWYDYGQVDDYNADESLKKTFDLCLFNYICW